MTYVISYLPQTINAGSAGFGSNHVANFIAMVGVIITFAAVVIGYKKISDAFLERYIKEEDEFCYFHRRI